MNLTRVFIHGLESSSQGTKGVFFREKYQDMIIGDFPGSFQERMVKLNNLLLKKTNILLVGSSYGGLMAAVFALNNEGKVRKLVLLAPALHLAELKPYLEKKLHIPAMIFHGLYDDVAPPESVHAIARMIFSNLQHHLVEDDHSLHDTFENMNWDEILKA